LLFNGKVVPFLAAEFVGDRLLFMSNKILNSYLRNQTVMVKKMAAVDPFID
jgi:hypothetical protein